MFCSFPNPYQLKIGSVIEYDGQSGEIKWTGKLLNCDSLMAGIEMVYIIHYA